MLVDADVQDYSIVLYIVQKECVAMSVCMNVPGFMCLHGSLKTLLNHKQCDRQGHTAMVVRGCVFTPVTQQHISFLLKSALAHFEEACLGSV